MGTHGRIWSAIAGSILALALTAAPVVAGGSTHMYPIRFWVSPMFGAAGTTVTMTMTNCVYPALWVDPATPNLHVFGVPGFVRWAVVDHGSKDYPPLRYLPASTWTAVDASNTTWTSSFTANLPVGTNSIAAWCNLGRSGGSGMAGDWFTVR